MVILKVDVIIPTKDPSKIRPKLLEVLKKADWVNNIIIETSKPLSLARVNGAKKCTTDWIAMFDDDVEIPNNWFTVVEKFITDDVVAISTPSLDFNNIHILSYKKVTHQIKPLEKRDTPFIDNTLIKKSVMLTYNPPPIFYSEDELLYRHAKKFGRWIHPEHCGVKHFVTIKDTLRAGETIKQLDFYPIKRFIFGRIAYFILPFFALAYSKSFKTVIFFYRININLISGYLKSTFSR